MFRVFVSLVCALSLMACKTMQPMPTTAASEIRAAVKVGDTVTIEATNGKTYVLELIEVDSERLVGVGDNKKVTIRYEQIESIKVKRIAVGRTVGLTAAVLGTLAVATILYFIIQFDNAFDD